MIGYFSVGFNLRWRIGNKGRREGRKRWGKTNQNMCIFCISIEISLCPAVVEAMMPMALCFLSTDWDAQSSTSSLATVLSRQMSLHQFLLLFSVFSSFGCCTFVAFIPCLFLTDKSVPLGQSSLKQKVGQRLWRESLGEVVVVVRVLSVHSLTTLCSQEAELMLPWAVTQCSLGTGLFMRRRRTLWSSQESTLVLAGHSSSQRTQSYKVTQVVIEAACLLHSGLSGFQGFLWFTLVLTELSGPHCTV